MMNTTYLFKPRSRDREILPVLSPHVLEKDTVEVGDQRGTVRVLGSDVLTVARDDGGSHLLAWLDGRKTLVMVDRADLTEVML